MINGAKAPDLPNYPFNSQLKLTAINIPSFGGRHGLQHRYASKIRRIGTRLKIYYFWANLCKDEISG